MMPPRWHKIISDLLAHKVRSLLVIASIAVGLFAIGMITTSYVILSEDIRSGYEAANPANIQVTSSMFDDDFVQNIQNLPGVAEAEGIWNVRLQVHANTGVWKPINVRAQHYDARTKVPINRPDLLEGVWPPGDKEIVLDASKLDEIGVSLGDELEIKLPSGTIRRLPIVGVVQDQTVGSAGGEGGFFLAAIQAYVTTDTLTWLEQPQGYNTLYATVDQQPERLPEIRALADTLLDEFEKNGYITTGSVVRHSQQHPNLTYVDAMVAVIFLLGFLVVFLSGFLITNTLSALLNQQVQQIGVMKTIGASRSQIIGLYMVLIMVFSLIALVISIPLSNQGANALLAFIAGPLNVKVTAFRPVSITPILMTAIALIVPQLAGSLPIIQGTRISVREALSGTGSGQGENTSRFYRRLAKVRGLSRPTLISMRNTFRRRSRLLLTLVTLTLGGATFIATFNVRNSLESYIDRLGHYFLADLNLTLNEPYRIDRVTRDVLQVPGVAAVEGWSGAMANVVLEGGKPGEMVQLVAPPADSKLIDPMLLEGRWIKPGDQNAIALSEIFKKNFPDLHVGDTIRLKIGMEESDWVVVGFFQFAGQASGLFAYVNYDYLAKETGMVGRSSFYRIVGQGSPLTLDQQEALSRRVESHLNDLDYGISELSAGQILKNTTTEGLNLLTTFLLIMSLLLASVGSIGLMGTMSLNVMERTREIGVMRAIGGSNRAIINIVLLEGVLIGLISWLLASLVALLISKQLADVMFQIIFDRDAALAFTFSGNAIWLGVVILLSVLASVVPAINASRLTIREVLAYE